MSFLKDLEKGNARVYDNPLPTPSQKEAAPLVIMEHRGMRVPPPEDLELVGGICRGRGKERYRVKISAGLLELSRKSSKRGI